MATLGEIENALAVLACGYLRADFPASFQEVQEIYVSAEGHPHIRCRIYKVNVVLVRRRHCYELRREQEEFLTWLYRLDCRKIYREKHENSEQEQKYKNGYIAAEASAIFFS